MASAQNVILDSIRKAEFASLVLDCVPIVLMRITVPIVSQKFPYLIRIINVNVKPAFISSKNRNNVFLAIN